MCVTAYFHQGEVEQIAMMKPKGQTEHDEGMLEYLEDIIGSCRLKEPINTLCRRVELLNEQRGEKVRGNTCFNLLSHSFFHGLCLCFQAYRKSCGECFGGVSNYYLVTVHSGRKGDPVITVSQKFYTNG